MAGKYPKFTLGEFSQVKRDLRKFCKLKQGFAKLLFFSCGFANYNRDLKKFHKLKQGLAKFLQLCCSLSYSTNSSPVLQVERGTCENFTSWKVTCEIDEC